MARPKNTVSITNRNKEGTMVDIWFNADKNRVRITRSTETILNAVLQYHKKKYDEKITCEFVQTKRKVSKKNYPRQGMYPYIELIKEKNLAKDKECAICGSNQKLHKHHVSGRHDLDRNNLIVLCTKHHAKIHSLAKYDPRILALAYAVSMGAQESQIVGIDKKWVKKLAYMLE